MLSIKVGRFAANELDCCVSAGIIRQGRGYSRIPLGSTNNAAQKPASRQGCILTGMQEGEMLILIFCCFCKIAIAQNDYQYWEREALAKSASWSYYTRAATAPNYPTYTSLYINGRLIASFNDAGTCRSKITELKRLAEQMYTRNASPAPTQPTKEYYDQMRALGLSKAEVDARLKQIKGVIDKSSNSSNAKKSQELLAKVDGVCSCQTVQNPNYNTNAKPYDNNNDLFKTADDNKSNGDNQSNSLFGESTQYENIFDAPSARNTAAVINKKTIQPSVSLNFDDMGKYVSDKKDDDGTTWYLGKSGTPANLDKDPSKWEVNTQKDLPSSPDLDNITLTPPSKREDVEQSGKEWLEKVNSMSPETLAAQEKNYRQSNSVSIDGIVKFADNKSADDWNTIYNSIGNEQKFATIIGFMNEANGGKMPDLVVSGENYVFAGNNGTVFIVAKDGSTISYSDLKGEGNGGDVKGTLGNISASLNNKTISAKDYAIETGQNPDEGNKIGASVSAEAHYNILSGNSIEFSIDDNGGITGYGTGLTVGPSISAKVGADTKDGLGASIGVSLGKVEAKLMSTSTPVMCINKDNSVSFNQSGIELSGGAGAKVEASVTTKKIKAGPLELGLNVFYSPDINGAVKQLPQQTALKMISDFANKTEVSTDKIPVPTNPTPQNGYSTTKYINNETTINNFLEHISSITTK